jgi:hypothetical protein
MFKFRIIIILLIIIWIFLLILFQVLSRSSINKVCQNEKVYIKKQQRNYEEHPILILENVQNKEEVLNNCPIKCKVVGHDNLNGLLPDVSFKTSTQSNFNCKYQKSAFQT